MAQYTLVSVAFADKHKHLIELVDYIAQDTHSSRSRVIRDLVEQALRDYYEDEEMFMQVEKEGQAEEEDAENDIY